MAVVWSGKDTYRSGLSGGSIYESEFDTFSMDAMSEQFAKWEDQMAGYNEIIAESMTGLDPLSLVGWEGSEYEEEQFSLLDELGEIHKSMSIDLLGQKRKAGMESKKMQSQFGRAGLAGAGSFERAESTARAKHSKSVWDTYSDFLSAKAGIVSDIAGAREDWWSWNQGLITDAQESAS